MCLTLVFSTTYQSFLVEYRGETSSETAMHQRAQLVEQSCQSAGFLRVPLLENHTSMRRRRLTARNTDLSDARTLVFAVHTGFRPRSQTNTLPHPHLVWPVVPASRPDWWVHLAGAMSSPSGLAVPH